MAAILKLFFPLNGLFGDGTISYLLLVLENYHDAKFHAFNSKWTIQAHIRSTMKTFSSSKLDKFTLFTHSFLGWNFENLYKQAVSIFFRLRWLDTVFQGQYLPKFEHKLRRHKQRFRKIATTVVLDKDENLLRSGLQRHRSCHNNEMTLLPILLAAVYLRNGNCSSKIVHGSIFRQ